MIALDIIEGPTYRHASDDADGWENYFYVVRLTRGTLGVDFAEMRTPWRQGTGIESDPTAVDVLSSLLLDACGYDNARTFEEWASEYGYDTDSRKAEKLYKRVGRLTENLRTFLGADYDATSTEDAEDAARRLVLA